MPDPIRTDRVRVMSFLKRKAGISVEEFRRYWESPHAEDFLSLDITKKNIIKYERAYPNSKYIADAESKGFPVPDWDGVVLLDGESYEKILEVCVYSQAEIDES
ncbi:hypothetical protein H0H81_012313 [Sphagnurus paluster]|uniref:EthD domain-containing protein n=1 Tax=Sphagnurus paluster TaxID=117069 RepID=A0A9P7FY62_9AGAR|nr:hypothetical protein H0H81_012313 [Sphagnurus paluster]